MLPILISVSLAPGSYFFCALAAVATRARDGKRRQAIKSCLTNRHRFLPSVLFANLVARKFRKSRAALASIGLFRPTKRHCCRAPIVIDARSSSSPVLIARPEVGQAWNRTHELVRDIQGSPPPDFASRAGWRRKPWGLRAFINSAREFADARLAHVREKLARGETVYLAGLGRPARIIPAWRWSR